VRDITYTCCVGENLEAFLLVFLLRGHLAFDRNSEFSLRYKGTNRFD
jgi:hypothetical protein